VPDSPRIPSPWERIQDYDPRPKNPYNIINELLNPKPYGKPPIVVVPIGVKPQIPLPSPFNNLVRGDGVPDLGLFGSEAFTEISPSESIVIPSMADTTEDPHAYTIPFDHGLRKDDLAAKFVNIHDPKTFEVVTDGRGLEMKNSQGERLFRVRRSLFIFQV
jgi:hypothetical protein